MNVGKYILKDFAKSIIYKHCNHNKSKIVNKEDSNHIMNKSSIRSNCLFNSFIKLKMWSLLSAMENDFFFQNHNSMDYY